MRTRMMAMRMTLLLLLGQMPGVLFGYDWSLMTALVIAGCLVIQVAMLTLKL